MSSTKNKTLVIYDTSVIAHKIIDLSSTRIELTNKNRDARIQAGIALYNNLFWIENANLDNYEIIWVGDDKTKPYWRVEAVKSWLDGLEEDSPQLTKRKGTRAGYKANRFHDPYRNWVMQRMVKFTGALTIPGYEADDVASAIVQQVNGERPIILATIDSDWLQLVNDRVTWVCMTGFNPQIRDEARGLDWLANKFSKESKKTIAKLQEADIDVTYPVSLRDIVTWKSLCGDVSDNLPANTPRHFIDLINPPEEFNLTNTTFNWESLVRPVIDNLDDVMDYWLENYGNPPTPGVWL